MLEAITNVLMILMQPCYNVTQNWWLALLLFTVLVKVILLPLSLWCQKNSIVMVQLMPALNRIKVKHFGDAEAIGEAQTRLNKEKHYHPLLSLVPLAVQILILFGLVDVVHYITDNGFPGTEFLGACPTVDGGASWIMPVLAGVSAVIMGCAQNRINPLQREQSRAEKNTTNSISIALSLFLGVFVAAGMCFYWICSNLTSIGIQVLCNLIIKPEKYIDYEDLAQSRAELAALENIDGPRRPWWKRDPLAAREKADYKRFMNIRGKHLVVYSEGSGFYKYFQGALEYVVAHSTCTIHYVTSDPNDQVFSLAQGAEWRGQLLPYYIGPKRLITLFMKMDAEVVAMTIEDLDNFYLKRSYVRQDIEYVFFFHHMLSTHLTPLADSYDHYDTLLCVGPHQVAEVRRREEMANLPAKRLIECGYDLLDREIAAYQELVGGQTESSNAAAAEQRTIAETGKAEQRIPTILIAPSWQEDNLLDLCIDEMLEQLVCATRRVIVRPHPEYIKRYGARWEALQKRWENVCDEQLHFEGDFSNSESIYTSDVLITDWSSINCEFSFSTLKPCIHIDTPIKARCTTWRDWNIEPTDITIRNQIGVSFDPAELSGLAATVDSMIANPTAWEERIKKVRSELIFNLGHAGEIAGEYLLSAVR